MAKSKETGEFVHSTKTKHFKLAQSTKRMMALFSWPTEPKLSEKEIAALVEVQKLDPKAHNFSTTLGEYKELMITADLSLVDARHSVLRDPLWKPDKRKEEVAEGEDANKKKKGRKGKRQQKMRKNEAFGTVVATDKQ